MNQQISLSAAPQSTGKTVALGTARRCHPRRRGDSLYCRTNETAPLSPDGTDTGIRFFDHSDGRSDGARFHRMRNPILYQRSAELFLA